MLIDPSVLNNLFSGNVTIYSQILNIFIRKAEGNMADIRRLFQEGNLARFTIEVHGLKGAAANLGALSLSETAKTLEFLGKNEDKEAIEPLLSELDDVYRQTVTAMRDMLSQL